MRINNFVISIIFWENLWTDENLRCVDFLWVTCVDQELDQLAIGHQELRDEVNIPVPRIFFMHWGSNLNSKVPLLLGLPSPSIALIRSRNPKLGEKFL